MGNDNEEEDDENEDDSDDENQEDNSDNENEEDDSADDNEEDDSANDNEEDDSADDENEEDEGEDTEGEDTDEDEDENAEDDKCQWEDWSEWTGRCRTFLGRCVGIQTRSRTSDNKLFNPGCCGFLCTGRQTETRTCKEEDCGEDADDGENEEDSSDDETEEDDSDDENEEDDSDNEEVEEDGDENAEDDKCQWEDWSEWTGNCRTFFGKCVGSQTRSRTSDNKLFNP